MNTDTAGEVGRALFGQTRRGVLALLYGRPETSFYLRQIARETGAGLGPVQRELASLTSAGLVQRTPRGHQVFFRANPDSLVYEELRGLVVKTFGVADALRSSLASLVTEGRIDIAFIYGSVAAGKPSPRSDIDLMLVGSIRISEMVPVLRPVEEKLGREINTTILSRDELADRLRTKSHFLATVLSRPIIMLVGDQHDLT